MKDVEKERYEKHIAEIKAVRKRNILYNKAFFVKWFLHFGMIISLFFVEEINAALIIFTSIISLGTTLEVPFNLKFDDGCCKDTSLWSTSAGYADESFSIGSLTSIIYLSVLIIFFVHNFYGALFLGISILISIPFLKQITNYSSDSGGLWFPGTGLGF